MARGLPGHPMIAGHFLASESLTHLVGTEFRLEFWRGCVAKLYLYL